MTDRRSSWDKSRSAVEERISSHIDGDEDIAIAMSYADGIARDQFWCGSPPPPWNGVFNPAPRLSSGHIALCAKWATLQLLVVDRGLSLREALEAIGITEEVEEPSWLSSPPEKLVVGVGEGGVQFRSPESAEADRRLWKAIEEATTWREFFEIAGEDNNVDNVRDSLEENEIDDLDAPFDKDLLPGYHDGDWPTRAYHSMQGWMPMVIQRHLCLLQATMISGDVLDIAPTMIPCVRKVLEEMGVEFVER